MTSDAENWEPSNEFERAFWAYAEANEAATEAVRLEKAAKETTGTEHRENLEGAAAKRAKAAEAIASLDAGAPEHSAADTPEPKGRQHGRPPSNAPAKLEMIVSALIEYAGTTGQTFDPKNAPGPLGKKSDERGSLHWFCAQLDQDFAKSHKTFSNQRAGLLAVEPYAKPTDFYRLALPHIAPKIQDQLKLFSESGKG